MSSPFLKVLESPPATIGEDPSSSDRSDEESSDLSDEELAKILTGYITDSVESRQGGPGGRDAVWAANWELYWDRMDFSAKAGWQSQEVMPEFSTYIDRFAAGIRDAMQSAGEWYAPQAPTEETKPLEPMVRKLLDAFLGRCGRSVSGHCTPFQSVFSEVIKSGSLSCAVMAITWDEYGLRIDPVDARNFWIDATGRGLYRRRRREMDLYQVKAWKALKDVDGKPLYDAEAIDGLHSMTDEKQAKQREETGGTNTATMITGRSPVIIDEFLCTIVDNEGKVHGENQLVVLANEKVPIRRERNPYWHEKDWCVAGSLIKVPFAPYGKTYAEKFAPLARAFSELNNLILDAGTTASMNLNVVLPHLLEDASKLESGVHPNMTLQGNEELDDARRAFTSIALGTVPPELVPVRQGLKDELRESANQSEMSVGQISTGDTTATEIGAVQANQSAMLRSIALDIETDILEPALEIAFQTILQEADPAKLPWLVGAVGQDVVDALTERRSELLELRFRFRVRGISALMERQTKARGMMQALGVIGQNQVLAQAAMQVIDPVLVVEELLRLTGVDVMAIRKKPPTLEEMMAATVSGQAPGGAGPGMPPGGGPPSPGGLPGVIGAGAPGPEAAAAGGLGGVQG